jgi:hypothetical protein
MEQTLKQMEQRILVLKVSKMILDCQSKNTLKALGDTTVVEVDTDVVAEHIVNLLREHLVRE